MAAGVKLVTGDTKVVDSGHGDGVYINTAGIGLVDERADIRPQRATPGDVVIISGDIGVHGVAVMSCRAGLEFATTVASDTAPLHGLVAAMLDTGADVHVLRDPTRGGVAATLNEIAKTAKVGVSLDERALPIPAEVRDACGLLGLDPLYVANEGKLHGVRACRRRRSGARRDAGPSAGRPRGGDRGMCHRASGNGLGEDGAGRHPRRRPADRRAATADLLNVRSRIVRLLRIPAQRARVLRPADTLKPNSRSHAEEFDGAWPYLQAIADAAGISDPLDDDVVRNYWVGGPLLDKVDPDELLTRLRSAFTGQVTGHPRLTLRREARWPTTAFTYSSSIRGCGSSDRDPTTPLQVMQDCRVRWGAVESVDGDHVAIASAPLTFAEGELGLGDVRAERVRWRKGGASLTPPPQPGGIVAAHWDWVCGSLTEAERDALADATSQTLKLVNASRS